MQGLKVFSNTTSTNSSTDLLEEFPWAAVCGLFFAMMIYQLLILASLLVFLGILLRNMHDLHDLPEGGVEGRQPKLSVLVPARNEEHSISACVSSLLAQEYANMEIIVLDDHSEDTTWQVLQQLAAGSGGKLRVVRGAPLPEGWHGKAWACHQLGEMAAGELMLFTDADTFHRPLALRRAVAALEEGDAQMLSLTPHQEMRSFWEKLIVPLVYHILFCYLPLCMVPGSSSPAFCYAIGQFILFRRAGYRNIGGHRSVSNNLVDDVGLCRQVKRAGGKVVVYNGTDVVSCRMYRDFIGIWKGFSKNLFAGLGYSTAGLIALAMVVLVMYIAPYGFFLQAVSRNELTVSGAILPAAQIAVAVFCRIIIAVKLRQPVWISLLHGLSQIMMLLIAFNSFRLVKFGNGPEWKGRSYRRRKK